MIFTETFLGGAYVLAPERQNDGRGFFARTYCREQFQQRGISIDFVQCNVSFNTHRGTLRGMHFQDDPYPEAKLVRCTRKAIYDVIVDLRPDSPTLNRWFSVELTEENGLSLYVPKGFAHGFQTLADGAEVYYQMGEYYRSNLARGVRWDDPAFAIGWPIANPLLSPKDKAYPNYSNMVQKK